MFVLRAWRMLFLAELEVSHRETLYKKQKRVFHNHYLSSIVIGSYGLPQIAIKRAINIKTPQKRGIYIKRVYPPE